MGNHSQYRISCVKMVCAECKKGIGCIYIDWIGECGGCEEGTRV